LILGGTAEASTLARRLAGDARFDALLSFAGVTRAPLLPPIAVRIGGFGGAEGLAAFLREGGFDLLIDATHPFAVQIKRNAAEAAAQAGVRRLVVLRQEWVAHAGDRWRQVADMAEAAKALGETPRRVLLTVGRKDLAPFVAAPRHQYVLRSVDAPGDAFVPPGAVVIAARGPFILADEIALLAAHRIDAIVTKNSGGDATVAKLEAARTLGIDVVMVRRPAAPKGEVVADVEQAWRWLEHQAAVLRGV